MVPLTPLETRTDLLQADSHLLFTTTHLVHFLHSYDDFRVYGSLPSTRALYSTTNRVKQAPHFDYSEHSLSTPTLL